MRRETAFLVRFLVLVTLFFLVVAPRPVNDRVVTPFTAAVARAGALACRLLGEGTSVLGTTISSPRFAVDIRNGCNGLETILLFSAAVLAFPVPWRVRLPGLLLGVLAIQLVNVVRIVTLFFIGVHFPDFFDSSHNVVWQALVVLFGAGLFLYWADKHALPAASRDEKAPR